ncbi:MAG: phosphotransferase [Methylomicrobium sp.]|nr:phosphotransferase [Methylomicrobium sp.]
MTTDDPRVNLMLDWLENDLSLTLDEFGPASNDASFRRYFRISASNKSYIVMDAPPDKENTANFIKIAELMRKASIHVPEIFENNHALGFMLLEDLGHTCFLDILSEENVDALYGLALDSLLRQQKYFMNATVDIPHYDQPLLSRELTIFDEWFLQKLLNIAIPDTIKSDRDELLINSALSQPLTFVHRDYHSRNLMVAGANGPGVIDFQDAVMGPITYDAVSLLKDCYISWPETAVDGWLKNYFQQLKQVHPFEADYPQFQRWFNLMGLQRHLKAIGIFSRLHLRDDKSGYLADIPRTLNHVVSVCRLYPELSGFSDFMMQSVLPVYERQA